MMKYNCVDIEFSSKSNDGTVVTVVGAFRDLGFLQYMQLSGYKFHLRLSRIVSEALPLELLEPSSLYQVSSVDHQHSQENDEHNIS
jgi:hypothetical protein